MNNYEKIKSMSVDEMAEFLKNEQEAFYFDVDINDVKQWLLAEVEE